MVEFVTCLLTKYPIEGALAKTANAGNAEFTARFAKPPTQVEQNNPNRSKQLILGNRKIFSTVDRTLAAAEISVPVRKFTISVNAVVECIVCYICAWYKNKCKRS
uniref:Uncharacterized protein n=1 Tax=Cryptomonas curvata TaxID=233186 RepID=A0A7S0MKE8_9CRYP|mmetsp:Transcript_41937/g.87654  ORF Transcript_41937/g.87654 Transcript_41937/m.87654 type:complete len:105 (+) Transcript_41937:180-494(+)